MSLAVFLRKRLRRLTRNLFLSVQRPFCEEVLVLGDSHAAAFSEAWLRRVLWRYRLSVVSVRGATASGLENPNSATQAFQTFERALTTSRAHKVIVLLGEVDAGFVIWYRAQKHGIPVGEALEQTCTSYRAFLKGLQARGLSPIVVSAPLPTIEDGNDWGEVANLRRSVTASQRQRTSLTLALNRKLADFCSTQNIAYIALDAASVGDDGLVRSALLSHNPLDHHYDKRAYTELLAKPVATALKQGRGQPARRPASTYLSGKSAIAPARAEDKRRTRRHHESPTLSAQEKRL